MVTHKLVRADGTTVIPKIKSFHYHSQVKKSGVVTFGNVVSDFIECSFYYSSSADIPALGEVLTYYQVFDTNKYFVPFSEVEWEEDDDPRTEVQRSLGIFNVTEVNAKKGVCTFTAYDNLIKLDVNYSPRLKELQSSFPMTIRALLDDAASYVGLTNTIGHSAMFGILNAANLQPFYADSISVRDLFGWAAELEGTDIGAGSGSNIGFRGVAYSDADAVWYGGDDYIVCPSDQGSYESPDEIPLINSYYKLDGLDVVKIDQGTVDCVKIFKSNGDLFGSYSNGTTDNIYIVYGNLFIDNISWSNPNNVAETIFDEIESLQTSRNVTAKLFPFRCYYKRATHSYYADENGNVIKLPVMSVDWTDECVTLESYGRIGVDENNVDADTSSTVISSGLNGLITSIAEGNIIHFTVSSLSSLPITINNPFITADHILVYSYLTNTARQTGNWTVSTTTGSVTIGGGFSGDATEFRFALGKVGTFAT